MIVQARHIIFLDIDGVIATDFSMQREKKYWYDERTYPFSTRCVKNLNAILNATNAEIVLSSDWRLSYTLEEMGKIFVFNGVDKQPIAMTGEEKEDRNLEIREFVTHYNIENFIILDDLPLTCYPERFIKIEGMFGMTQWYAKRAVLVLNSSI